MMPMGTSRDLLQAREGEALDEQPAPLGSPVFELELDDDALDSSYPTCISMEQFTQLKARLRYLIGPSEAEKEICQDVHTCIANILQEEGKVDLVMLASRLTAFGYIPVLRTAPGGGHGVDCFKNLYHSFLCLHTEAETDGRHIFVDPDFKEQFVLQPRVQWYESLLDIVPEVFVGDQSKIKEIVQLLTKAMAQAFSEQGCGTPPWRSNAALLSKWLPKKGIDRTMAWNKTTCKASPIEVLDKTGQSAEYQTCRRGFPTPRKVLNVKPLVSPVNLQLSCSSPANMQLSCSQGAKAGPTPCLMHEFSV